jgi:hypothetical protein
VSEGETTLPSQHLFNNDAPSRSKSGRARGIVGLTIKKQQVTPHVTTRHHNLLNHDSKEKTKIAVVWSAAMAVALRFVAAWFLWFHLAVALPPPPPRGGIKKTSSGACSPNRLATQALGTSRISRMPLYRSSLTTDWSLPSWYNPIKMPVLPFSGPAMNTTKSRTSGGSFLRLAKTSVSSGMLVKYFSNVIMSS